MFLRLKRLYEAGRLTADGIAAAVKRGWITAAQAEEITAAEADAA
ncbi:MAG: XkdX family protein [Butyricicoccus sp.]|nr:XkdX family protein [Butyricicoccus sp.]MBQ8585845.1 XkdX family protein [Butyricicoccus sp.]